MPRRAFNGRHARALVIGLDGVPHTLLQDYVDRGYLPETKRILDCGFALRRMDASIPDVSSTSWTSFMTGVNPGEHGIYGFMELEPGSYEMRFPNSADIMAPTLWEIIGRTSCGKRSTLCDRFGAAVDSPMRSVVLNIPQTYPATAINGVLTAGFVCPDLRKGTYPDSCYDYLMSIGYVPDVDSARAVEDRDGFIEELFMALEKRRKAFEHFFENEEWDLFIGVITETDRLHHFFFDGARDAAHPLHGTFISFYRKIDEIIGKLFNRFMELTRGEGLFLTMSDHGFSVVEQTVNVNAYLSKEGFLKKDVTRRYFDMIDTGTRAFAMDPSRIYINLECRYPRGSVSEADRTAVVEELKEKLLSINAPDGTPVIRALYEGSELYSGPHAGDGPDLVALAHEGFDLKAGLQQDRVFSKGVFKGMHTQNDAHCIMSKGLEAGDGLHIEDLAGLILDHLTT